jgi:hypothetical protein
VVILLRRRVVFPLRRRVVSLIRPGGGLFAPVLGGQFGRFFQLSATDGFGNANSKYVYRAVIRWTMKKNGHQDKVWPADWFDNDVSYLALKIL